MSSRIPTDMDRVVGQRIRIARKAAKLSQSKLGDAVGVTYQQIQKYENGTDRIGAGRLYRIAQETDQPISFFFNETETDNQFSVSIDILSDPKIQNLIANAAQIREKKYLWNLVEIANTFAENESEQL